MEVFVEGKDSSEKAEQMVNLEPLEENFSANAFHLYAVQYYECKRDFRLPPSPPNFSLIPYFLLCRAIELELKARHLRRKTQDEVKDEFWHHLLKAYNALDARERILSEKELAVLETADELYNKMDLAYFNPAHAMKAYEGFPDLNALDAIAKKLIESGHTTWR